MPWEEFEITIKKPNELERLFERCRYVQIENGHRIMFEYWNVPDDPQIEPGWEGFDPEFINLLEQLSIVKRQGPV